jgi:hypothetical protein
LRRLDKWLPFGDRQNCRGTTNAIDSLSASADDALQCCLLRHADRSQRLALWSWHPIFLLALQYPASTPAPAIYGMTH